MKNVTRIIIIGRVLLANLLAFSSISAIDSIVDGRPHGIHLLVICFSITMLILDPHLVRASYRERCRLGDRRTLREKLTDPSSARLSAKEE
jgi:hypothetical protein